MEEWNQMLIRKRNRTLKRKRGQEIDDTEKRESHGGGAAAGTEGEQRGGLVEREKRQEGTEGRGKKRCEGE